MQKYTKLNSTVRPIGGCRAKWSRVDHLVGPVGIEDTGEREYIGWNASASLRGGRDWGPVQSPRILAEE